jgi:ABC-2 type transport system permease protein
MTLHAEWTKLRTSPGTPWLLLAVIVATVGLGLTTAFLEPGTVADPVRVSLTGIQLGQAVVAILAVLAIGGEYSTGMIRVTLAATPRRETMLAAKAALLAGAVLVAAVVAVAASLLCSPLDLGGAGPVLRAGVGSVLYLGLIALLSLGVATIVRSPAAAIGVVLGLLFVVPLLIPAVADPDWQRHLLQIVPTTAGLAIQATTGLADLPISPWKGLGVLAAWSLAALLGGGLVLRLRDA